MPSYKQECYNNSEHPYKQNLDASGEMRWWKSASELKAEEKLI